jgi:phosphoesterase RecJ-like protein
VNAIETLTAIRSDGPFVLGAHERPDGDSVGSMLALSRWLENRGRDVAAVFPRGVPEPYADLPGADGVAHSFPDDLSDTTLIVVDTPLPERMAGGGDAVDDAARVVVIDHHPDNTRFGDVNLVDPTASSAALLVYEALAAGNESLDAVTASLLFVGIMTDTGGFRFGNTDERTLRAAAALVAAGARPAELSNAVYGSQSLGQLRLLGLVLSSAETVMEGAVAFLTVTDAMRADAGSTGEEIEGLASYGRLIDGVEVAVLLREEEGRVRISMRSAGRVDVNALARRLGGGGHRAASGALVEGSLDDARREVLDALGGLL